MARDFFVIKYFDQKWYTTQYINFRYKTTMDTQKGRVEGKIAMVTGAADGIGKAIAMLLAREGAKVIITDINDVKGEETAKECGAEYMHLDVSSEGDWQVVADKIASTYGGLHILVNNAGIMGKGIQDPENVTFADWQLVHKINLDSVFLGCKYAIKLMKEKGGSIINMSSRSAVVGVPNEAAYASSKAAIRNHTKSVALHCAQHDYNIRCNAVFPASIETAMWHQLLGDDTEYENKIKERASHIPLKRFGKPEEVAYAVLYLASDESSYTTGSELYVDGGVLAGTVTSPGNSK